MKPHSWTAVTGSRQGCDLSGSPCSPLLPTASHLALGLCCFPNAPPALFVSIASFLRIDTPHPNLCHPSHGFGPGLENTGSLYIFPRWHFSGRLEQTLHSTHIWICVYLSLFCSAHTVAPRYAGLALPTEFASLWCLAFKNLPHFTDGEAPGDTNTGMCPKKKRTGSLAWCPSGCGRRGVSSVQRNIFSHKKEPSSDTCHNADGPGNVLRSEINQLRKGTFRTTRARCVEEANSERQKVK